MPLVTNSLCNLPFLTGGHGPRHSSQSEVDPSTLGQQHRSAGHDAIDAVDTDGRDRPTTPIPIQSVTIDG